MRFTMNRHNAVVLILGIQVLAGPTEMKVTKQDPAKLCPKKNSDGAFKLMVPHPSCNMFYRCSRGAAVPRTCPVGLLFDDKRLRCDFPHKVNCHNRWRPGTRRTMVVNSRDFSELPHKRKKMKKTKQNVGNSNDEKSRMEYVATIVPSTSSKTTMTPPTGRPDEYYVHESSVSKDGFSFKHPHSSWSDEDSKKSSSNSDRSGSSEKSSESSSGSTSTEDWDSVRFSSRHSDYWYPYHKKGSIRKHKDMRPKIRQHWDDKGLPLRRTNNGNNQIPVKKEKEFHTNGCPVEPTVHWLIPHVGNCTLFYECHNGEIVLKQCSYGLHFNAKQQVCDWPEDARCNNIYDNINNVPERLETTTHTLIKKTDARAGEMPMPNIESLQIFNKSNINKDDKYLPLGQRDAENGSGLKPKSGQDIKHTRKSFNNDTSYNDNNNGSSHSTNVSTSFNENTQKPLRREKYIQTINCPVDLSMHWLMPYVGNCTLFYECHNGSIVLKQCSVGLYFNAKLQVCDWPENVICNITNNYNNNITETLETTTYIIINSTDGRRGDKPLLRSGTLQAFNKSTTNTDDKGLPLGQRGIVNGSTLKTERGQINNSQSSLPNDDDESSSSDTISGRGNSTLKGNTQKPAEKERETQANRCPIDPTVHWLMPDVGDCTLFYECHNGENVLKECRKGLHFNAKLQICDRPEVAECNLNVANSNITERPENTEPILLNNTDEYKGDESLLRSGTLQAFNNSNTNTDDKGLHPGQRDTVNGSTMKAVREQDMKHYRSSRSNEHDGSSSNEASSSSDNSALNGTTLKALGKNKALITDSCPVGPAVHWMKPYEANDTLFYECHNGEIALRECTHGLKFNAQLQICNLQEDTKKYNNNNTTEKSKNGQQTLINNTDGRKGGPVQPFNNLNVKTDAEDVSLQQKDTLNSSTLKHERRQSIEHSRGSSSGDDDESSSNESGGTSGGRERGNRTLDKSRSASASVHTDYWYPYHNTKTMKKYKDLPTKIRHNVVRKNFPLPQSIAVNGSSRTQIEDLKEFLLSVCPLGSPVHWVVPHTGNSSLYHECRNGEIVLRQCGDGLHFNAQLQVCDGATRNNNKHETTIAKAKQSDNNSVKENKNNNFYSIDKSSHLSKTRAKTVKKVKPHNNTGLKRKKKRLKYIFN